MKTLLKVISIVLLYTFFAIFAQESFAQTTCNFSFLSAGFRTEFTTTLNLNESQSKMARQKESRIIFLVKIAVDTLLYPARNQRLIPDSLNLNIMTISNFAMKPEPAEEFLPIKKSVQAISPS